MRKKLFSLSICLFLFLAFLFIPTLLNAQGSIINPSSAKYEKGDYDLNDILSLAIWSANWILGIVGSLTLLMFIYGGFTFLISAGSTDKISDAKKILTASVIGLIIVFTSFLIVQFVTTALGMSWNGQKLV